MTREDILHRLTLKDDPDAAEAYRRLLQRGGGDGRATSAEVANASAPAEQQADGFDALLRAANMHLGKPDGPAWCFYLSRERCIIHPFDDPAFDAWVKQYGVEHPLSIAVRVVSINRAHSFCTKQPMNLCGFSIEVGDLTISFNGLLAKARQAFVTQNTIILSEVGYPADNPPPVEDPRALPSFPVARPLRQPIKPKPTQGPPRKRPTLATAPRR
jgi:hypothetical protein